MWNPDKIKKNILADKARQVARVAKKHTQKIGARVKDELLYGGPRENKVGPGITKTQAFIDEQMAGLRRTKGLVEKGGHYAKMHTVRRKEYLFDRDARILAQHTGYSTETARKEVFLEAISKLAEELKQSTHPYTGELLDPENFSPENRAFKRFVAGLRSIFEYHPKDKPGAKVLSGTIEARRVPGIFDALKSDARRYGFAGGAIPDPSPREISSVQQYFEVKHEGKSPNSFSLKTYARLRKGLTVALDQLKKSPALHGLVDIRTASPEMRAIFGSILIMQEEMIKIEKEFNSDRITEEVVKGSKKIAWEGGGRLILGGLLDFGRGIKQLALGVDNRTELLKDAQKRYLEEVSLTREAYKNTKKPEELSKALKNLKEAHDEEIKDIKRSKSGYQKRYNSKTGKYEKDPQWGKRFAGFLGGLASMLGKASIGSIDLLAIAPAYYVGGKGYAALRKKI